MPKEVQDILEEVSPITIETGARSIKVGLSRRFLLFRALNWLTRKIEDDPHLNFISILKSYKALGDFIDGTLHELHRDRNTLYFREFFVDAAMYKIVKNDLEWMYKKCAKQRDSITITVTKRGVIIYDNYQENSFNTLLLTVHSGTWMRKDIQEKQAIGKKDRLLEEDIATHHLYCDLVLQKGGVWIDNKASRFGCDYNRTPDRAIYSNGSEEWVEVLWKEELSKDQRKWLMDGYDEFYHLLRSVINTHRFNIIFDGHSMKDLPGRPGLSFGTKYIPAFYMPIVQVMQRKLRKLGYDIQQNKPFPGGKIIEWMAREFPDRFICSMEINKALYMTRDRTKVIESKCTKLSHDLAGIFDIEDVI